MNLPPPINLYFTAQTSEALASAFASDAEVLDEGQTHRGRAAIQAWWQAAKAKYRHGAEPLDLSKTDGKTVVRAKVTGDFPGSPVILRFTFGLQGSRIRDLRIGT